RATAPVFDRRFDMAAGETQRLVVRVDRGGDPAVYARIDARGNALAIDDEAVAWFERARPLAITVVGEQTDWLARLFAGNPDVTPRFVTPAAYRSGQEDAIVFDRWAPPEPPQRPALYFAPPAQGSWITAGEPAEDRPRWMEAGSHPVVRGVDPFTLDIERARTYTSDALTPVASSVRGT